MRKIIALALAIFMVIPVSLSEGYISPQTTTDEWGYTIEVTPEPVTATQEPEEVNMGYLDQDGLSYYDEKIQNQFGTIEETYNGNTKIKYELGNISITNTGWAYNANNTRVRTPENYTFHLKAGDKIGLTDYTDARFFIGGRKSNGTYVVAGWLKADYVCQDEADYIILVCNNSDRVQQSAEALGSLISIYKNNNALKNIANLTEDIEETQKDISDLRKVVETIDGKVAVKYEIGNITINNTGWTYNNYSSRVRTPENYSIPLENGDTIGLTNYSDARFVVGCRKTDGSYIATGWMTSDYIAPADGDYVLLIANTVDRVQQSADDLGKLISIKKKNTIQNNIDDIRRQAQNVASLVEETTFDGDIVAYENGKYITKSGAIVDYDPFSYSNPIPVQKGDVVKVNAVANTAVAIVSYCTSDFSKIEMAIAGVNDVSEYNFVSERNGYITICYYTNNVHKCVIKRDKIAEAKMIALSSGNLWDKTVVWLGDSIMRGNAFNDTKSGWAGRVSEATGCQCVNYGIGGACITEGANAVKSISQQLETAHTEYPNADYVIFDGGCNDADELRGKNRMGTWNKTDYSGNYDRTTFCGAFESICYRLTNYYKGKHVGYIIPHKMGTSNIGYEAGTNEYRTWYEEAIGMCKKWGIPVLNMWDETYLCPMLRHMCDTDKTMSIEQIYAAGFLYADRQHLTDAGYNFEAPIVTDWINGI